MVLVADDDVIAALTVVFLRRSWSSSKTVWVEEAAVSEQQVDQVVHHLVAYYVDFLAYHLSGVGFKPAGRPGGAPVFYPIACSL